MVCSEFTVLCVKYAMRCCLRFRPCPMLMKTEYVCLTSGSRGRRVLCGEM